MFAQLCDHSLQLIRGFALMPPSCDPMQVYSYTVVALNMAHAVELTTVSDTFWRVCSQQQQQHLYAMTSSLSGASFNVTLAPHNQAHADSWRTLLTAAVVVGENGLIEDGFALQLSQHVSTHSQVVAAGSMLVLGSCMPWHLDADSQSSSVKIWRLPSDFFSREVFSMSEQSDREDVHEAPAAPVASEQLESKPKSKDAAFAMYEDLTRRIAALDGRVWDPKHVKTTSDAHAALQQAGSSSKSKDVNRFCNLLVTLGKRVAEAEDAQRTKLPDLLKQLAEIRSMLNELSARNDLGAGLVKRRESNLVKCVEFEGTASNLLSCTKDIGTRHVAVTKLLQEATAKAPVQSRTKSSPAAPVQKMKPLVVPVVDLAACQPLVLTGKKEWEKLCTRLVETKMLQAMVQQHATNTELRNLWNSFSASMAPILAKMAANKASLEGLELDFTAASAYHAALQQVYDAMKAGHGAPTTPLAATAASIATPAAIPFKKARKAACKACDEVQIIFIEDYCRGCFVEEVAKDRVDQLNEKIKQLRQLADAEEENEEEEDGKGQFTVLADQMDPLHDLVEAKLALLEQKYASVSTWQELEGLLIQADRALAVLPKDDWIESDGSEDGREQARGKKRGEFDDYPEAPDDADDPALSTPSGSSDEEDEEEERASGSSSKHAAVPKRYKLADQTLHMIYAVPVHSFQDKLVRAYVDGRYDSLSCTLRDSRKDIKEVFGIRLTDVETKATTEWPTFYETYDQALTNSLRARIKDVTTAEVFSKPVHMNGEEDGGAAAAAESQAKRAKKDE
jgi:hypothetical protein